MSETSTPRYGPPPDPREHRQQFLVQTLRVLLGIVIVLATISVVLGDEVAHDLAVLMVTVLAAAPIVRLVWLIVRWTNKGDRRYAAAATGLILMVGVAAAIGLV